MSKMPSFPAITYGYVDSQTQINGEQNRRITMHQDWTKFKSLFVDSDDTKSTSTLCSEVNELNQQCRSVLYGITYEPDNAFVNFKKEVRAFKGMLLF